MIRRLLTAASVLSLVLCLATIGMWVRSYRISDQYAAVDVIGTEGRLMKVITFGSQHGGILWLREWIQFKAVGGATRHAASGGWEHDEAGDTYPAVRVKSWQLTDDPSFLNRLGFYMVRVKWEDDDAACAVRFDGSRCDYITVVAFTIPYWSLVLTFVLAPAVAILHVAKDRRRRCKGLCPACGYDLRATRDRCPECGSPIPAEAKA